MHDFDHYSVTDIRQRLSQQQVGTSDLPAHQTKDFSLASVLIPFVRQQQQWHLLYIRRAYHEQDYHSGQVAFAGGKFEPEDRDMQDTALREAHEEIGLHPDDVTILGQLNSHHSVTRFKITPVVGQIPWPYDLTLDASEVAHTFTIPLSWLAEPANYRIEERSWNNNPPVPVIYFNEYDGELLWGATARMTLSLLSVLGGKDLM